MADIRFWLGMIHRASLKRNDKLLIGNIDTTEPNYIDVSELLQVLTTDDLPESDTKKYVTPEEKNKLATIAAGVLTLAQAAEYFYPLNGNPASYLTSGSAIASAKLTGQIAAALIPDLNAAKITTGILAAARIPDLPASKITSGTFSASRIPQLSQEKIVGLALELEKFILSSSLGNPLGPVQLDNNQKVPVGNIPDLNASKITSGIFSEDRIPTAYLKASQLVTILNSTAVNLPAAASAVGQLKEYIDRMLAGLKLKDEAACATTGNVVLQGEQLIDGFQTEYSRVVVRLQDNPAENGLYLTGPDAWTRTEDADTTEDLISATVVVIGGDTFAGDRFICSTTGELGVDDVTWTKVTEYPLNEEQYLKVDNLPAGEVETVVGAQAKADAALQAAKDYADSLAIGGGTAPIAYTDMAALYAGQANQILHGNYRVDDASGHPDVNAGRAWFDFKGATYGDHRDYILKSEEESLNLDAQLTAIENRLTALETKEEFTLAEKDKLASLKIEGAIPVPSSRALALSDHKQKLCIADPGIVLTYPAAGLGEGFEFNAVTNASGTLTLADENSGNDIDGLTFLPENSMGHVFKWPTGLLTTKGDWE